MVLANAPLCEGFAANGTGVRTPHGKTHFAADFGAPAPGARTWDRLEIDMSEPKKHPGNTTFFQRNMRNNLKEIMKSIHQIELVSRRLDSRIASRR